MLNLKSNYIFVSTIKNKTMKTKITKEELKGFVNAVLASHPNIDWTNVNPTFRTELLGGYQVRVDFEWNIGIDHADDSYIIDTTYIFLEMKENRFAKEFENLFEIVEKISEVEFNAEFVKSESKSKFDDDEYIELARWEDDRHLGDF